MPREDDSDPWWRFIVSSDEAAPRILARLPFAGRGNARSEGGDALVVGTGTFEPTGEDHSFVVFETEDQARQTAPARGTSPAPGVTVDTVEFREVVAHA